uniref:Uncharacterized protein n=1 Tax=Anguilla anguilla TaxID=7936 RepID=A0A0E9V4T0_ANGAN
MAIKLHSIQHTQVVKSSNTGCPLSQSPTVVGSCQYSNQSVNELRLLVNKLPLIISRAEPPCRHGGHFEKVRPNKCFP